MRIRPKRDRVRYNGGIFCKRVAGVSVFAVDKLISEARRLAAEYRRATGKSLPISSEIAKHDACVHLDLEPCEQEAAGYDAVSRDGREQRIQIKGRAIFDESKSGQRIGQLKLEQDWDAVVLVLMDEDFDSFEIYQAWRDEVLEALHDSSRNKRGAMSVARFRNIARLVWTREEGRLERVSRDPEQ